MPIQGSHSNHASTQTGSHAGQTSLEHSVDPLRANTSQSDSVGNRNPGFDKSNRRKASERATMLRLGTLGDPLLDDAAVDIGQPEITTCESIR